MNGERASCVRLLGHKGQHMSGSHTWGPVGSDAPRLSPERIERDRIQLEQQAQANALLFMRIIGGVIALFVVGWFVSVLFP